MAKKSFPIREVPARLAQFTYTSMTGGLGLSMYVLRDVEVVRSKELDKYNLTGTVVVGRRGEDIIPAGQKKTLWYIHESAIRDGFVSINGIPPAVTSVGSAEYVSANPVNVRPRFFRGIKSKK